MFFVVSKTHGLWRGVDQLDGMGNKLGERVLVMAAEQSRWCVDCEGIDVLPGMCVTFRDPMDAEWFLGQGRAVLVAPEPGIPVMFALESDAEFFVRKGLADPMSRADGMALLEADREHGSDDSDGSTFDGDDNEPGESDMQKLKPENKAMKPAAETKKGGKPAPKAGAKKK